MFRFARTSLALLCLALLPAGALAAGDQKAAEILFETRHLDLIDKGSEVTYRFERVGSNARLVGENYTDDIRLGVTTVNEKGERDVVFKVFTGDHARDPQNWPELTINPIFVWYLDRAVSTLASLAGSDNSMYFKARFREALRDKAGLEQIKYDYNGKSVDAFKVTVAPFVDDPNASKMAGFQNSLFTIVVSNQVPGYFVDLQSNYVSKEAAAPKLDEHIKLVGMGEAK
jgi:hypothetical protein